MLVLHRCIQVGMACHSKACGCQHHLLHLGNAGRPAGPWTAVAGSKAMIAYMCTSRLLFLPTTRWHVLQQVVTG